MRYATDNAGNYGRRGSFWHEQLQPAAIAQARVLAQVASQHGHDYVLDTAANNLIAGDRNYVRNVSVPWRPLDVLTLGADLQERFISKLGPSYYGGTLGFYVIRRPLADLSGEGTLITWPDDSFILQTLNCEYILLPVDGEAPETIEPTALETRWAVPFPGDIRPMVIARGSRYLCAGIDFTLQRNALVFRENPFELFAEQEFIHVLAGTRTGEFLLDYTTRTDYEGVSQQKVAHFYRSSQAPVALQEALADIAGRWIVDTDATITAKQVWCDVVSYQLDGTRWVEIPYKHTQYNAGDTIQAGTIFGGGIRVAGGKPASGMWHREFAWNNGIDMGEISPFSGLTIPDHPMRLEAYAQTGSYYHVRPWLEGDDATLARYWAWIKDAEIQSNYFINDELGLSGIGQETYRNGVDFFFEYCLETKALVVELDRALLGSRSFRSCQEFVRTERLHNTVLLLLTL